LPPESFTHNGQVKWSPAIFTFWVRRDFMRDQIVIRDTHPDWEWLPVRRNIEADVWMQMWGIGVGDIKPPDNLGEINRGNSRGRIKKINDWSSHGFIKEIRPGTIKRLKRINWRDVIHLTLSSPRLYKDEVVGAYIAAYGAPETADYNPEDGSAGGEAVAPEAPAPPAAPPEAPAAADPDSDPDLEWISLRRGVDEATVWLGRRGPNVGKIVDGTKQVPTVPGDHYALKCKPPAAAILRSIRWRSLAADGTLSKHTIRREYTRVKLAGLPT
jgi:hypothetical protein